MINRSGSIIYKIAAISNFIVTAPVFIAYNSYVKAFAPEPPNYPFLVWIWSGMAFLWGVMFWEISCDIEAKRAMIKYTYLEKSITSLSVFAAWINHNVPALFFIIIIFTDIIWIPVFVFIHLKMINKARLPD